MIIAIRFATILYFFTNFYVVGRKPYLFYNLCG
jgi:hypothetical protein